MLRPVLLCSQLRVSGVVDRTVLLLFKLGHVSFSLNGLYAALSIYKYSGNLNPCKILIFYHYQYDY